MLSHPLMFAYGQIVRNRSTSAVREWCRERPESADFVEKLDLRRFRDPDWLLGAKLRYIQAIDII
jgi:hypothetical protein